MIVNAGLVAVDENDTPYAYGQTRLCGVQAKSVNYWTRQLPFDWDSCLQKQAAMKTTMASVEVKSTRMLIGFERLNDEITSDCSSAHASMIRERLPYIACGDCGDLQECILSTYRWLQRASKPCMPPSHRRLMKTTSPSTNDQCD